MLRLGDELLATGYCILLLRYQKHDNTPISEDTLLQSIKSGSQDALGLAKEFYQGKEARAATTSNVWELFKEINVRIQNCVFIVDGLDECGLEECGARSPFFIVLLVHWLSPRCVVLSPSYNAALRYAAPSGSPMRCTPMR